MFRGPFRLRRSEMNIAIDLIPGPESIDKDRFTYPTFAHRCPPLRLGVSPVYPGA
jgi:hypothetical protein